MKSGKRNRCMRRSWISLLTLALAMLLFASSPLHVYADEPNEQLDMRPDKSSDMGGGQDQPPAPVTTGETQGGREADSYTPPSPPPDPDIVKHSWKNDGQMEQNRGSIEDNRGTIKENFGAIAYNGGTVERHFWSMNTVMSPGDYSISYGDGFRMEKDADGKLRLFLESGTDGIVTILPPDGKVVTKVVFMVNGVEVVLEPLGGGKYKISAPGMPTGPDGFALNEGGIIVLTEDGTDAGAAADREQKFKTFNNWFDGKAPGFAELVALDEQRNGKKGGIRIEGIPEGRSREEVLEELAARPDVRLAMVNALLTAAEGGDETLTFITEDGVRVTTSLSALRALLTHFLPVRETKDAGESIIYQNEQTGQERTEEEMLEEVVKIIGDTTEDFYILDYTYETTGLELTIIFQNEEEKKKFEDAVKVYLDERGEPTESEPIRNMTEFEENCRRLGLDLNYYLENPDRVTDGTFAKDIRNRVLLREAGLPNDLLNAVPLDNRAQVLYELAAGTFDNPEQRQRLIRELGEEAAQELLQRWQEEVQNLQEKIRNEMTKHSLPLEMLNTGTMAKMSYAELQRELDRIKNATPEERGEWKQAYEQELQMIEQSNNRLNYLHLPEDMLDSVPPAARHSILEKIENGTLDASENRWLLNTWLGEEGAAKLIRDVKQIRGAYARNKLVEYGLPANWMNLYPSDQRAKIEAGLATATDADLRKFADDYHKWTRESQDMLRQMNLPADLLKQIPVDSHRVILDQIKAGYLENENMKSTLEDLYGKEVINQLVKDVKQAQKAQVEAKKENAKKKLVEYGMPADWMDALSPEERAKVEEGLATATDAELKALADEQVKLYRASQERLKQMDLPADLLKKIPVGAHIPLLDQIKAGYLEDEKLRSVLEKKYGKEVINQLLKDVKQAKTERVVRTELERYKLPADLLKTVPVDSQEKVLSAIKSGNLEPQRESLEKALGKDGYKTFENNFYAAMAAAQPKELPQDLLRRNVPWKQHGDYMAKYKSGTVKDRQFILTMIGYY